MKDKKDKWILKTGTISEENIQELICRYFTGHYYYLAGCTDSYCSGRNELTDFLRKKADVLLELRVFSDDKELLFSRSLIGHDFNWRITTDKGLEAYDYIDYEQYLDINL